MKLDLYYIWISGTNEEEELYGDSMTKFLFFKSQYFA
jgi:hypothetical protein